MGTATATARAATWKYSSVPMGPPSSPASLSSSSEGVALRQASRHSASMKSENDSRSFCATLNSSGSYRLASMKLSTASLCGHCSVMRSRSTSMASHSWMSISVRLRVRPLRSVLGEYRAKSAASGCRLAKRRSSMASLYSRALRKRSEGERAARGTAGTTVCSTNQATASVRSCAWCMPAWSGDGTSPRTEAERSPPAAATFLRLNSTGHSMCLAMASLRKHSTNSNRHMECFEFSLASCLSLLRLQEMKSVSMALLRRLLYSSFWCARGSRFSAMAAGPAPERGGHTADNTGNTKSGEVSRR